MRTIEQRLNMFKHIWRTQVQDGKKDSNPRNFTEGAVCSCTLGHLIKSVTNSCITFILGAHFNPPGEAFHKIINIPPITLLYTKERLHIIRCMAKYGYTNIISSTHKSTITKNFLSDLKKVVDRHTQVNDIWPEDLSKRIVDKTILSH